VPVIVGRRIQHCDVFQRQRDGGRLVQLELMSAMSVSYSRTRGLIRFTSSTRTAPSAALRGARHEIVIEGTSDAAVTFRTEWRAYEFKGKPGDPARLPPQIAPYHLRLDCLMWFAALSPPSQHPWFVSLLIKLLSGDRTILRLLRSNPFPDAPPQWVRAMCYEYHFTSPAERHATGRWWTRREIGPYVSPSRLHVREQEPEPAGVGVTS
jgi:Lipase maturation factor